MVLNVNRDHLLSERSLNTVEVKLLSTSLELAVLGQVSQARELASLYYYGPPTVSRESAIWAWKETGQWPEGIPEEQKQDEFLRQLTERWDKSWPQNCPKDMAKEYTEKCIEDLLDATTSGTQVSTDMSGVLDARTGGAAYNKSECLVKALDISLFLAEQNDGNKDHDGPPRKRMRMNKGDIGATSDRYEQRVKVEDLDSRSADIVKQIAGRWNAKQQITCLAAPPRLWPYLVNGLMSDALGCVEGILAQKSIRAVEIFRERLRSPGAAPSQFQDKSMRELLEIGDYNSYRGAAAACWRIEYDGEAQQDRTLFKDPATSGDIQALEKRLGVTLPDDYKDFLKISNGFNAGMDDGIFDGYGPGPGLYSIDKVTWDSSAYFQLPVQLLGEPSDGIGRDMEKLVPATKKQSDDSTVFNFETPFPLFDRVLMVGVRDIDNLWLVHPKLVDESRRVYLEMYEKANEEQKKLILRKVEAFAGSMEKFKELEWCCFLWSSGGAACFEEYPSFRAYLETVVESSGQDKMEGHRS